MVMYINLLYGSVFENPDQLDQDPDPQKRRIHITEYQAFKSLEGIVLGQIFAKRFRHY